MIYIGNKVSYQYYYCGLLHTFETGKNATLLLEGSEN